MTWVLKQSQANACVAAQTAGLSVTLTATVVGNLLVCICGEDERTGVVLNTSDNKGQSYTVDVQLVFGPGGERHVGRVLQTLGGVTTVTVTPSALSAFWLVVEEWQPPANTTVAFDIGTSLSNGLNAANPQSTGTTSSPIVATTDLLIAVFDNPVGTGAALSFSTPSGYTLDQSGPFEGPTSGGEYNVSYNITPIAGTQQALSTVTCVNGWETVGMLAAYKATPTGGGSSGGNWNILWQGQHFNTNQNSGFF